MNDYWLKRAEAAHARSNKSVSKALPELISNMQDARRALEKEINAFYARYASNNKITLAEAQKALSFSELADFKGDLKSFRRLAKNSIGRFDLEVDNLSVQARITRLQALETQCDAILQRCYQAQRDLIEKRAADLAQEQYLHSLYDIEQYTGFRFPYSQLSTSKIKKMVEMPVNGADISTSLWRQDIDTGFQIRRVLNNMFTTGRPPQDFAKELQKIIGQRDSNGNLTGKTYEAYRLLYNESAHISEQASMQAYTDDGIDQYEITATFDKDACKHCQELDGKVYDCKDAVPGVNMPPFHVNCRCTTVPYIPEAQGSYTPTRAARDPETGKTIRVKKQSFEEWKAEQNRSSLTGKESNNTIKAVSGARITNQFGKTARAHAERYYGLVRSMSTDVDRIAKTTGINKEEIRQIKEYIFNQEHDLGGEKPERFAPDFAMAQSWQRLIDGRPVQHDLTLIYHELMEKELVDSGLPQWEAHRITSQKYNYSKESDEYYASLKKHKSKR